MKRKVIFLDIDGTLTEPGSNRPPESAVRAVREARRRGHFVFLCTGRNYDMLSPLLTYGFDGFAASSGGYVKCGEEVIYDCPMTKEQRQTAMDVLKECGIFRTVECMDGSYTDEEFKEFLRSHAKDAGNSEMLRWREQIEKTLHILPMKEYRGQPVYKMVLMMQSRKQLEKPVKMLGEMFDFCIQEENHGGFLNGEMISKKFHKGKAVQMICTRLGISKENALAFGDSMNDREMLEAAGTSVCMGNGSSTVKAIADDICPAVSEDGIYQAFLKYQII